MKPDPKQYVQFDNPKSGCGLGCWAIGCTGVIAVIVMLCGGGFYGLFYTSLPLRLIEAAIEEDGEVEIEGLQGSLATGFSADELRFKTVEDKWSNLTDIKFKYAGNSSIFGSDRLIIEELSVNGGTIYADWDPEESEFDFESDIGGEFDDFGNEFDELGDEFRDEFGSSPGIKELRVDLVRIANLKIVNPTTQLTITLDEVKFEGFQFLEGDLKSMGKLLVKSSQLELETVPSIEFDKMKNSERFAGTLKMQADHRLKADMPFDVDFAVDDDFKLHIYTKMFGEELQFLQTPKSTHLTYEDFTPADFFDLKNGRVLQENVKFKVEYGEKIEKGPTSVNQDGEFKLGKTRFFDLKIETPEGKSPYLIGQAEVNGERVTASVRIDSPYSPLWKIKLDSESYDSPEELWSHTLFGSAFSDLTEQEQNSVRATMPKPEPAEVDDEAESAAEESTDTDDGEEGEADEEATSSSNQDDSESGDETDSDDDG